ncbi:MAG: hypothetical protein U9R21_09620, partial [Candidatus Thermoplasmatota archaeon]|nr:hypothetical protein [Candidatus Thermoplasmatota archaeon]
FDAFKTLQKRFALFKKIEIKAGAEAIVGGGFQIDFLDDISHLPKIDVARALESLIRIIFDDISEDSGLYFITEIKNHLRKENIDRIIELGIDFGQIQSEQHYTYARKKRKKVKKETGKKENPLGYGWDSVAKWNYNEESKQVELYDKQGKILDKIDLQQAIRHYVESLSGTTDMSPLELANLLEEHEKSYSFLKLIYYENLEYETAKKMLSLNDNEIDMIIKELVELKFLQYVSDDEIEITKSGKEFMDVKVKTHP